MVSEYSLMKPSSLIEAKICTYSKSVAKPVKWFASAKVLTLARRTVMTLKSINRLNIPVFPNMVKLIIAVDCMLEWDFLRLLLTHMPNLEHITLFGFAYQNLYWIWNPPEDAHAPACLNSKMKEIIILNHETVTQEGVIYIMYLLKHTNILEKLTINAHEIAHNYREQILNCHRGSNFCQIDFV